MGVTIDIMTGSIFEQYAEAWVNPVNCVGVMGKGLALEFKKHNILHYDAYKKACDESKIDIGKVFVYNLDSLCPKYIIDFPTKNHWKDSSNIEYIDKGMDNLLEVIAELKINSIAIPALGCGLGGLNWNAVQELIINKFTNYNNNLHVLLLKP
jgi:O-acetyl-ADP-ribose deacetylase (regulator of RNase III)